MLQSPLLREMDSSHIPKYAEDYEISFEHRVSGNPSVFAIELDRGCLEPATDPEDMSPWGGGEPWGGGDAKGKLEEDGRFWTCLGCCLCGDPERCLKIGKFIPT